MVNNDEHEEHLADLIATRALHPDMAAPEGITATQWDEIGRLADIENALFDDAHGAPPLHEDPVAALLGLVLDPHLSLDGAALTRARKAAGIAASELATTLRGRGWHVSTSDVLRWQTRTADDVSPALVKAIAAELGTSVETLTTDRGAAGETPALEEVMRSPAFESLVQRFALIQGMTRALAASTLRARGLATVHRGDTPAPEQWLHSLDAFVSALEDRNEP